MERAVTVNEYRSISTSQKRTVRHGRNREGKGEYGLQKETHEGARPLGLTILPHRLEKRGAAFIDLGPGEETIHFVRVYEDGREERI